jgi:hypothetical protein
MTPKIGDYILYDDPDRGDVVVKITRVTNNDLVRFFKGECVLTGQEVIWRPLHG